MSRDGWYEALHQRRSRRQYTGEAVPPGLVQSLGEFCRESRVDGARALPIPGDPAPLFRGLIGAYGRIIGAPWCIAFAGSEKHPAWQENTGYLGQQVVLEATSLGLNTCWVAWFFNSREVNRRLDLEPGERVLAVTPVGLAPGAYTSVERHTSGFLRGHRRRPLDSLCRGLPRDRWPAWIETALSAARLAPSAVNRQPWRFLVEEDAITVMVNTTSDTFGISRRLDCGIAMLQLEVGAEHAGVRGCWEHLSGHSVARYVVR